MKNLQANIQIKVQDSVYLKDPDQSEIGRKIVSESISLIDEMGLEKFTFKKLGLKIG